MCEKPYLSDVHVMDGVDTVTDLLNVLSNGVRDQLVDNSDHIIGGNFLGDDVNHLLTDGLNLSYTI